MDGIYRSFPHNPPHFFAAGATYMITAATYQKRPHLLADERKANVLDALQFMLGRGGWTLIACAVMTNHYHAVIQAPRSGAGQLSSIIASVHKFTARRWNRIDNTPGRTVWWNYWDTCLTNEASLYARVNYVHFNPVKHGLAAQADLYMFSTYHLWLERWPDELSRVESDYPCDSVRVYDEF